MPTLALTDFNIVVSVLGGWVSLFGLVSYLCKERFYLSEALISLLAGVAFSPAAANFIRPLDYAGSQANLDAATLAFSRLVLGVQLVLAGVQLPSRYLQRQWRPLACLLGPVMVAMWLTTSVLVWALAAPPRMPFLHALAIGSCVTPTDPVLSNVIVKGRFADQNVPVDLQQIIIGESGANDGLGYPFLFLALYLIQYTGYGGDGAAAGAAGVLYDVPGGGARHAMGLWFGETMGYTILLSVAYGAAVGFVAKELLHWAEERRFVDRESFLVFAVSLALFIMGTCGLIGSDDVLACFIAGNVFTWDDWFRLETKDDSLQPTVDMLLNVTVFMWYGAVCPWSLFARGPVALARLVGLGLLLLLLRRLPWVFALRRLVPQIGDWRQAVFVGFFGPVGVSAIFYLYITLAFLDRLSATPAVPGSGADPATARPDVARLGETATAVVWFFCICSVVVHGLSIPLGKLGVYLPRTLSRGPSAAAPAAATFSSSSLGRPVDFVPQLQMPLRPGAVGPTLPLHRTHDGGGGTGGSGGSGGPSPSGRSSPGTGGDSDALKAQPVLPRPLYRIGGTIIPSTPPADRDAPASAEQPPVALPSQPPPSTPSASPSPPPGRSIRFPDDPPHA